MRIVVQKYGGSSVADVDRIRRVAERITRTRNEGYAVVAVVSAMGKSTDELIARARSVSPDPSRRELDMLVSVGENDFRVPEGNALAMFAALQRMGVPSRLIVWPDENHWILKGENSRVFYREVRTWLEKYLLGGAGTQ